MTAGGAVWQRVQWLDAEIRAGRAPTKQQFRDHFRIRESCATQTIAFMRRQLELPLHYDPAVRGYTYRDEPPAFPASHPGMLLPEAELTALRLAVSLAHRYLDPDSVRYLEALSARVLAAAPQKLQAEHARWERDVVFTGPPPLPGRHLPRIKRAIERCRVVSLDYRAPGHDGEVTREVEPHFLVNAGGDWLLVGWDRARDAARTFALARIQWCEPLEEKFERRSNLTAEAWTRYQFLSEGGQEPYELVVRFGTEAGRIARERRWHPTQEVRTAADGRLELTMKVSGTGDVLRWLLAFGGAVEVMAPEVLRQKLHAEALAAAALNGPGDQ